MSKEEYNRNPFVIRAHHLEEFRSIIEHKSYSEFPESSYIFSPEEMAQKVLSVTKAYPDKKTKQDVLGSCPESENKFVEHLQKTYKKFLALPNDYPAEIVEGIADERCKGCAVGESCRELPSNQADYYGPGLFNQIEKWQFLRKFPHGEDTKSFNLFIKVSKKIYPDMSNLIIIKEKISYLNSKKIQRVRRLKTTIGVVKQVITYLDPR
jgi:hypothetical protein